MSIPPAANTVIDHEEMEEDGDDSSDQGGDSGMNIEDLAPDDQSSVRSKKETRKKRGSDIKDSRKPAPSKVLSF